MEPNIRLFVEFICYVLDSLLFVSILRTGRCMLRRSSRADERVEAYCVSVAMGILCVLWNFTSVSVAYLVPLSACVVFTAAFICDYSIRNQNTEQ